MKRDREETIIFEALKGVETPAYDIWEGVVRARQTRPEKARRPLPRTALAAACLAALFTVGALAAGFTVGWETFLGRTPEKAVTAVGASQVTGEYTLTLQEAIVDDDGAAFLLALTRNDGGVIEGDPRLEGNVYHWDVELDGAWPNMGMTSRQPVRAEDGKSVYYCVEFEAQGEEWDKASVMGTTITFQCDGVADMDWSEEEMETVGRETVSLAPLAATARRMEADYEDICRGEGEEELLALVEELSAQAAVPLERTEPGKAQLSAVLFTDDGPLVAVDWRRGQVRQGQYLTASATAQTLTDTRTGERWGCTGYARRGDEEGFYLCKFEDCPLTAEDLPYVEVTVGYGVEKILSDEPVELSFSVGEGHQTAVELDEDIAFNYIGDCTAHVTGADISALRLKLTFDRMERPGWNWEDHMVRETRWALREKDGTQILLSLPIIRQDEETGTGYIRLIGVDENNGRRLIDPDQVEALMVGQTVIPLG